MLHKLAHKLKLNRGAVVTYEDHDGIYMAFKCNKCDELEHKVLLQPLLPEADYKEIENDEF